MGGVGGWNGTGSGLDGDSFVAVFTGGEMAATLRGLVRGLMGLEMSVAKM